MKSSPDFEEPTLDQVQVLPLEEPSMSSSSSGKRKKSYRVLNTEKARQIKKLKWTASTEPNGRVSTDSGAADLLFSNGCVNEQAEELQSPTRQERFDGISVRDDSWAASVLLELGQYRSNNDAATCANSGLTQLETINQQPTQQQPSTSAQPNPGEGSRIVEINYFLEQLQKIKHAEDCTGSNLQVIDERFLGSYSLQTMKCMSCQTQGQVYTNRPQINELMTLSSMAAGQHITGARRLLNPLNVPIMNPKTYDRWQHIVGQKVLRLALASCRYWATREIEMARDAGMPQTEEYQHVRGETDGCYSKRSYGNNYSSMSGGVAFIGQYTKRVIDFEVAQTYCQTCKLAANNERDPPEHHCPINFAGSAPQMEPELVTRIFQRSCRFNGAIYSSFVGDGDSSVQSALRRALVYIDLPGVNIRKIECKNHILRNYTKHMRNTIQRGRLGDTAFQARVIKSLPKLESELNKIIKRVHDAQGSPEELREQLERAIFHHFGRHQLCLATSLCRTNPNDGAEMVKDSVFESILSLARTRLLCFCDSLVENADTNMIESFNNKQATMTDGKRKNYSMSWHWVYKYALSVLSWNSGQQDPVETYKHLIMNEELGHYHEQLLKDLASKRNRNSTGNNPVVSSQDFNRFINHDKDPIAFEPDYKHPMISDRSVQVGPIVDRGYSSDGIVSRPDLPDVDLYAERDLVLNYLLRLHRERDDLMIRTVKRFECEEWVALKSRTLSSELYHYILKSRSESSQSRASFWPNKVKKVLYEGSFKYSEQFLRKIKKEEEGRRWLADRLETEITKVGAVLHPVHPFLMGNPAGLIGNEKTVEVVYLDSHRGLDVEQALSETKWISKDTYGQYSIKHNTEIYCTIQANMAICNRTACIVVLATDSDFGSFEIEFDQPYWLHREPTLIDFFYYVLVELADSNRSRSLPPREYQKVQEMCTSQRWRSWPR